MSEPMAPYFYSLGMIVTSRGWSDHPTLTPMDLLAEAIADEEREPSRLVVGVFGRAQLEDRE